MATNTQGIFGLSEFYNVATNLSWPKRNREEFREFGYLGGGSNSPATVSFVERIDFSNDTATASYKGPLTLARTAHSASGNLSYGWFYGGATADLSANYTTVDRIDYSNDVANALSRTTLPIILRASAGGGNSNYGYVAGGVNLTASPAVIISSIYRLTYSNDTGAFSSRGILSTTTSNYSSASNLNYMWAVAGQTSPSTITSIINRIDYANDLGTASARGPLSVVKYVHASSSNNEYGYFYGGSSSQSPFVASSSVDRMNFANDTVTTVTRSPLSAVRYRISGTGNSNFGYAAGGCEFPSPNTSRVERIDYANDTFTLSRRGDLRDIKQWAQTTSKSSNFGGFTSSEFGYFTYPYLYFSGGVNPSPAPISSTERVDYNNDTKTPILRDSISIASYHTTGVSNVNYGYVVGGRTTTPGLAGRNSQINRLDYSNDTMKSLNPLPLVRDGLASYGNANYGWFGGGTVPYQSAVYRMTYSNDNVNLSTRGPLTASTSYHSATSNKSFGYSGGGYDAATGATSTTNRVDFSNDTVTASSRGKLSIARYYIAATGNENYGYWAGGNTGGGPITNIDRLDFANDTETALAKGNLTFALGGSTGSGNSQLGYFNIATSINRIDYANDTSTASHRTPTLSNVTSNSAYSPTHFGGSQDFYLTADYDNVYSFTKVLDSYGYFSAGFIPSPGESISTVNRIDYSNETTVSSTRGNLYFSSLSAAGTTNNNFGFVSGGYSPGYSYISSVQRIDYSNDNAVSSVRNFLSAAKYRCSGTGNPSFGYIAGGSSTFPVSLITTIDRVDYSNELSTALVRGSLESAIQNTGTLTSNNYGYYLNLGSGSSSIVQRIDFSNDSANSITRGPLSTILNASAGTSNSTYGYAAGSVPTTTIIDRIDFTNDGVTSVIKGNLSTSRSYLAGTGNLNYGWFGGGFTPSGPFSTVDRIDYANDTLTASVRGPLSLARGYLVSSTNAATS